MRRLDCFFREIGRSLKRGYHCDGHSFKEVYSNDDVTILRCQYCPAESVGYNNPEILEEFEKTLAKVTKV